MATIGLRGGSSTTAALQVNGADFLTVDTVNGVSIPTLTVDGLESTVISTQTLTSTALSITGSTSGNTSLITPAVAGNNILTLPTATGTVAITSELIGKAQTWQIVTRGFGTTYTNTTSAPIMVYITCSGSGINTITVGGVAIGHFQANSSSVNSNASFIVPVGATYSVSTGATLAKWSELRE